MMDRVWESVVSSAIYGVIIFVVSLIGSILSGSNTTVTIGNSIKVEDNQFFTSVNINAFEDVDDLRVSIPITMRTEQIKSNKPIKIEIIKNNIGTANGSVLEIERISSDNNVELILVTDEKISTKEIVVNDKKNEIDVEYSADMENPIKGELRSLVLNALIYALVAGLAVYIFKKNEDKRAAESTRKLEEVNRDIERIERKREELQEEVNKYKQAMEDRKKEIDIQQKRIDKVSIDAQKRNILLQAKLYDYRKELSFWRDTIRKIIYQLPDGKDKAEQLIRIVSSSLKTYQTNEKENHNFETLKVLSKWIKDINQEEKP
ncbi:hypothetical protein V7068_12215 [Bacillus sp. JJ634]